MSSDKLAALRRPVVLLTLHLQAPDASTRDVVVELGQTELDALLADFSNINHVLKSL